MRRFVPSAFLAAVVVAGCADLFGVTQGQSAELPGAELPGGELPGELPDGAVETGAACVPDCEAAGATRCEGTQARTCRDEGGCLRWSPVQACEGGGLCCAADGVDRCVPADEANCFGCGVACTSPLRCLSTPRRCGCSVRFCAPFGQGCDTKTGDCAACPDLDAAATEVFVDPAAFGSPKAGSSICPFRTVTDALAYARAHDAVKTITLAEGVYTDEKWPLQVRGVTVRGAGKDKTILAGEGTYDHTAEGGQFSDAALRLTVLLGSVGKPSALEALTLRPGAPSTTSDNTHQAILCDRGNLVGPQAPKDRGPAANSFVRNVAIDKGYGLSMGVSTTTTATDPPSADESGCNVEVVGTDFRGGPGRGVWALGGGRNNEANRSRQSARLVLGAEGAAPTTFRAYVDDAILGWDGLRWLIVENTVAEGCGDGMAITQHAGDPSSVLNYYEIRSSVFREQKGVGVSFQNTASLAKLENNRFEGNGSVALQLRVTSRTPANDRVPSVLFARGNVFVGNGAAVAYTRDAGSTVSIGRVQDWGREDDPGRNVFRCNGVRTRTGPATPGAPASPAFDFQVQYPYAARTFLLAGNAWDHAPPTTATTPAGAGAPLVNGTDVVEPSGSPGLLLSGAVLASEACPARSVP